MSEFDENEVSESGLTRGQIQAAARAVAAIIPPTHGFTLLLMPFSGNGYVAADYISNVNREDSIKGLKTVLFRWVINEEWMTRAK